MKSPLAISTRLSAFRLSLSAMRSPVSPITPKRNDKSNDVDALSICHSASDSSSPSAGSPPGTTEKGAIVTVVDDEQTHALRSPMLLTPRPSPITPWHATFHRNAATTEQETAYLRRTTNLRYARLTISMLLLLTCISLVGLQSSILARYNQTHLSDDWHLSLWPTHINLKPTIIAITVGSIVALFALASVIISVIPSPNPRVTLNNIIFTSLCLLTTFLSLANLIISTVVSPAAIFSTFVSSTLTSLVITTGPSNTIGLTPNGDQRAQSETIQSFTCAISNTAKHFNDDASALKLPTLADSRDLVPSGFSSICQESKAGLVIAIVVLSLAVVGLLVSAWTWAVQRGIERLRGEREVIASRTGSRDFKIDSKETPESLVGSTFEKTV